MMSINFSVPDGFTKVYKSTLSSDPKAFLNGVTINKEFLEYRINVPIRHHSAQIDVKYNKSQQYTNVKVLFFGLGVNNRWEKILWVSGMWGELNDVNIIDIVVIMNIILSP